MWVVTCSGFACFLFEKVAGEELVESRWACLTDCNQSIGVVRQEDPHKHLEINGALEAIICTFLMCMRVSWLF
jgi:hypothetical protein